MKAHLLSSSLSSSSSTVPTQLVITDCKVLRNPQGKSRKVCFVGVKTSQQAQWIVNQFHHTYAQTSQLAVDLAFGKNDKMLPQQQQQQQQHRPWSQHSQGSSKYEAKHSKNNQKSNAKDMEVEPTISDTTKQINMKQQQQQQQKQDLKKQEFLSAMGVSENKPKFWQNDDGGADAIVVADHHEDHTVVADDSSTSTKSSTSSSSDDDDAEAFTSQKVTAAPGTVLTDQDFLRKNTTNKVNLDSDDEDNEDDEIEVPMKPEIFEEHDSSDESSSGDSSEEKIAEATTPKSDEPKNKDPTLTTATTTDTTNNNNDDIPRSNRLFIRNLPFSTTEEDLRDHFGQYGTLLECHVPVDDQKRTKGFAFCTFEKLQDANLALEALDSSDFQGRWIHVIPARPAVVEEEANIDSTSYKQTQELLRQKQALQTNQGWSASFVRGDAVVDNLAERLGIRKGDIFNLKDGLNSGDAAVRLALAETQLIEENREYFRSHGINMDALVSSSSKTPTDDGTRSSNSILVKNLPFDTKEEDLMKLFSGVGDAPNRILLPPSRTIAMVEYNHASDAKRAFKKLAYKRFKHVPLYLEWAPLAANTEKQGAATVLVPSEPSVVNVDGAEAEEDALDNGSMSPNVSYSIYVKNLNFATTEDQLLQLFTQHVTVRAVKIPTKVAAIKKGQTSKADESDVLLSMGFGFVECDSEESVRRAIKSLQGYVLDGHALELKRSSKAVGTRANKAPDAKAHGKNPTKLMVRNVPFQASRTEILKLFGSFGQLKKVRLPKKFDGGHRGFAFIEFLTSQEAQSAMHTLSRTHLYGRHLVLEWADDKDDLDTLRDKAKRDIDEKPTPKRVNKKIRFD